MPWLSREIHAACDGFKQLARAPLATCVTAAVIGITLTFPAALKVVIDNGARLNEQLKQTATVTVYLKPTAGYTDAKQLAHRLRHHPSVLSVRTVSPENGLRALEEQTGLDATASALPENPLPWVIIVTPKSTDASPDTLSRLKSDIEHSSATDTAQLDTEWVTRLDAILKTTRQLTVALTALLSFAVLLITGNTIWAVIRRYSRDIHIIRLAGDTAGFIRRPFLYSGALYGLIGAGIAWLMTSLFVHFFSKPIQALATLYNNGFVLEGFALTDSLWLLSGAMILGLLGAWIAVTGYLRMNG